MTLTICDGFGLGMKKWVLLYNQSPDRNNPTLASLSCLFPCLCHFLCLCLIPNTRSQGLRMSILHNKTSKPEFRWVFFWILSKLPWPTPLPQFRQLVPLFLNANVPKNWAGVSPLIWTKFKRTATFFVKPSLMPVVPEERFCDKSYFQFFIRWLIFLYSLYNLAQLWSDCKLFPTQVNKRPVAVSSNSLRALCFNT